MDLIDDRPGWAKYTASHVVFWQSLLDDYIPRLPAAWMRGVALPDEWARRTAEWPYLIPRDMWDGTPDHEGSVQWKRVPGTPRYSASISCRDLCPALLQAYLQYERVCRLPVCLNDRTFLLPETPSHCPTSPYSTFFQFSYDLALKAHLVPVLYAEDRSAMVCIDVDSGTVDGGGDAYLFPLSPLFRLRALAMREGDNVRAIILDIGTRLGCELRELLASTLSPANAARLNPPLYSPASFSGSLPASFDWERVLPAEPPPTAEGLSQFQENPLSSYIEEHIDRIASKLTYLRHSDCFAIRPDATLLRYLSWPQLLPEDLANFEQETGCHVPDAYAAFLSRIGNGIDGPGQGICRLEWSHPSAATLWGLTPHFDPDRLRRPFPQRSAWLAGRSAKGLSLAEFTSHERIDGTILLCRALTPGRCQYPILLVANGAEAGHIWADQRLCGGGIVPLVRRGPCSFLYWYETWLDGAIAEFAALRAEQIRLVTAADR